MLASPLRDIMHLMGENAHPAELAAGHQHQAKTRRTIRPVSARPTSKSVDFKLYRKQVQVCWSRCLPAILCCKDPLCQPVADHELDELRKLVLVQNPNVDIRC